MDLCCDYTSLVILATTHCSVKSQTTPESLLVSTESCHLHFYCGFIHFSKLVALEWVLSSKQSPFAVLHQDSLLKSLAVHFIMHFPRRLTSRK